MYMNKIMEDRHKKVKDVFPLWSSIARARLAVDWAPQRYFTVVC